MTEDINGLSKICEVDDGEKVDENVIVISRQEELLSFILDILDFGDHVESEEELENNHSYRILNAILKKNPVITIVIERQYVDKIYRDSYYMHFSCKHGKYNRFCKRLFVFDGDVFIGAQVDKFSDIGIEKLQEKFVGTIVIRPLKEGKIGRTLINPYFVTDKGNVFLRYAKYSATIYGMRLQINAFPFSMQDGETTTCAEITILNLMDYFSIKYPEYKSILPSEIAQIAEENGYERNLPTRGLGYTVITKVFSEVGFFPRLYTMNLFADMSQFKRVMHYYIESGLPVAIGVKVDEKTRHSIIGIGHGKIQYDLIGQKVYAVYDTVSDNYIWLVDSADLSNSYIMMDDCQRPYETFEWRTVTQDGMTSHKSMLGDYEPDNLMVPLYKRMFLEAQDAYDICTSALASSKAGIQVVDPKLGIRENPIIIRLFMCASRNYKQRRVSNFSSKNKEVRERYMNILFPKFIWVCEIYDKRSYCERKALGEIVIDATASPYDGMKSILLYHYPHYILVCQRNINRLFDRDEELEKVNDWEPFDGYDHNLFAPETIKYNEYKC